MAASRTSTVSECLRPNATWQGFETGLADLDFGVDSTEVEPSFSLGLSRSDLGRVSSRNGASYSYDLEGRRLSDDRFDYVWNWRGELVSGTVKACWPLEPLQAPSAACGGTGYQSPYAGQKILFEREGLGRLLTRTHLGGLPAGETDEAKRPFIEKRRYLWEGETLLSEAAYAEDRPDGSEGPLRWRKSYVPGGGGITSQVQLKVEVYDGAGVSVASERLFSYLSDEQGTVLGLVGETTGADPTKPPVAGRYFYTPFGEARVEAGLEPVRAGFEPSIAGVTAADGSTKSQGVAPGSVGGALTLRLSAPVDPQTYGGLILEKLQTDGSWLALLSADLAIGRATPRPEELAVLPLAGWQKDSTYRLRLTSVLKDTLGRSAPSLTISLPIPSDGAVAFERTWPALFENYLAAGNELGGLIPGGQPLLFQGMYVDPVLGLAITKNRIYDARSGAWLSPDPLDDIDSPNLYGFVANRPQEKTDPLGLITPDTVLDIAFITYDIKELQKDPKSPLNWAAFGVDVLFAIIPGFTGGGPGLRLAFAGAAVETRAATKSVQVAEKVTRRGAQGLFKANQMASSHRPSGADAAGDGGAEGAAASGLPDEPKTVSSHGAEPSGVMKPPKGTPEGDVWRYERYKNSGGQLSFEKWFEKSRGGRAGSFRHELIKRILAGRKGFDTEVKFGQRFADAAGPGEIHQIGELNKRGDPIARERDAINDILRSPEYHGQGIYFWDKTNPMAAPIKNPQLLPNWGARP